MGMDPPDMGIPTHFTLTENVIYFTPSPNKAYDLMELTPIEVKWESEDGKR